MYIAHAIVLGDMKRLLIDELSQHFEDKVESELSTHQQEYLVQEIYKFVSYVVVVLVLFLAYLNILFSSYGQFIWKTKNLLAMLPMKYLLVHADEVKQVITAMS